MTLLRILIVSLALLVGGGQTAYAKVEVDFSGVINFEDKELDLTFALKDGCTLQAQARKNNDNDYQLTLNIDHLRTRIFDFSSAIESEVEVIEGLDTGEQRIQGKIWSKYSLIDYQPIKDLTGRFEIKDEKLYLQDISFGQLRWDGKVDLVSPFEVDIKVDLVEMDIDDFLNFWIKNKTYDSSGPLSGEIKVSGDYQRLLLQGKMESFNGFIKDLNYDSLTLNVEGFYPKLYVSDSSVSKDGGVIYSIEGAFDLSDGRYKKQLRSLNISPLVSDSGTQRDWTIKRVQGERGTTELKYLMRKKDNLQSLLNEEDTDMFGFVRKMEF